MTLEQTPSALSLALVGLDPSRRLSSRALIERATALEFRSVQLDATAGDLRPRDLDRSARRGLAALLRRTGSQASGVDLWISPGHFASGEHQDRAIGAARAALEFAADLVSLGAMVSAVVSIELPEDPPAGVVAELLSAGDRYGAVVAEHGVRDGTGGDPRLAVGIDPAAVLMGGQDPAALAARAGDRLASARLSDLASAGRVAPLLEGGRLDALAYKVALRTAGYDRPPVLDLRGVKEPLDKALPISEAWERVVFRPQ